MEKNFEIEINPKHQLLDLNSDVVNFDLNFKVESQSNDVFHALVLSKNELDTYQDLNEIQMKESPGIIKGNIKSNDNNYQNYFLILKKMDGSTKANVNIQLEELEKDISSNNSLSSSSSSSVNETNKGENRFLQFYNHYFYHILLVLFLIGMGLVCYNYMQNRKNTPNLSNTPVDAKQNMEPIAPKIETPIAPTIETPIAPKIETPIAPKIETPIAPTIETPAVDNNISSPQTSLFETKEKLPIQDTISQMNDIPENISNYLKEIENSN